jgi:hypothetical protein
MPAPAPVIIAVAAADIDAGQRRIGVAARLVIAAVGIVAADR